MSAPHSSPPLPEFARHLTVALVRVAQARDAFRQAYHQALDALRQALLERDAYRRRYVEQLEENRRLRRQSGERAA